MFINNQNRILGFFLLIYTFINHPSFSQNPIIENVRVVQENTELHIYYNLSNNRLSDSVYCQVFGKESGIIAAVNLKGDIGTNIFPGKDKKIIWDIRSDAPRLNEEIKVTIFVTQKQNKPFVPKTEPAPIPKEEKSKSKPYTYSPKRKKQSGVSRLFKVGGFLAGLSGTYFSYQIYQESQQLYKSYVNNNWNQKISVNSTTLLAQYSQGTLAAATSDFNAAQNKYTQAQILLGGSVGLLLVDFIWTLRKPKTNTRVQYQLYPSTQPQFVVRWRL